MTKYEDTATLSGVGSSDWLGVTATCTAPDDQSLTITVLRWTTAPTDSDEPLWYTQEMTRKEWAVLRIREQPFYT